MDAQSDFTEATLSQLFSDGVVIPQFTIRSLGKCLSIYSLGDSWHERRLSSQKVTNLWLVTFLVREFLIFRTDRLFWLVNMLTKIEQIFLQLFPTFFQPRMLTLQHLFFPIEVKNFIPLFHCEPVLNNI